MTAIFKSILTFFHNRIASKPVMIWLTHYQNLAAYNTGTIIFYFRYPCQYIIGHVGVS